MIKLQIDRLLLSSIVFYLFSSPVTAQIVPDNTLPSNSSVTTEGINKVITEGTQAGSNLFHSFEQFSVPTGGTAYFNNSLEIQNIISRVTGGSISSIDGLLRANGTANLFLINPNGIIFGRNASLNIGGSFVASTASSLNFPNNVQFSASSPQTPLLTVNVPIGLEFGNNPRSIQVQGDGQGTRTTSELIDTTVGLRVQPKQTLALVGGDVVLEGGTLKTAGGRIEIGSVAGDSLVNLNATNKSFSLSYEAVPTFRDIQLSLKAAVDASGIGGGDVQVQGRRVTLTDGSQIETSTLGSESGGTLSVTASESVDLVGSTSNGQNTSGLATLVYPEATGNAGNLTIETRRLSVRDGAQSQTTTLGAGTAGNLTIKAKDLVEIIGTTANGRFPTFLNTSVQPGATGNGGNLTIETNQLLLRDGARIQAATSGTGEAGALTVRAKDLVELIGTSGDGRFPTALNTSVQPGATGNGGNLTIETNQLLLRDGAQIGSVTAGRGEAGTLTVKAKDLVELIGTTANGRFPTTLNTSVQPGATGNAGNLTIETNQLLLRDGAQIGAATAGRGEAGTLTVKAKDLVELIGAAPGSFRPSALSTRTTSSGNAGNLRIETAQLIIRDGARATVNSEGSGRAGQLEVQANSVYLDNQAQLLANSFSGEGGNIELQVKNSLQMRRNSQISTTSINSGNGGNITINTGTLAAHENSDIFANATNGVGGGIEINAQGIFGIEPRSDITPESDITADSGIGIDGEIEINTLGFDARNTLTPLQSNFITTEQVVAGSCLARRNSNQGKFVVTGSGGLPTNPYSGIEDWELLTGVGLESVSKKVQLSQPHTTYPVAEEQPKRDWQSGDPIIEAQGFVKLSDGRIVLGMKPQQVANAQNLVCSPENTSEKS